MDKKEFINLFACFMDVYSMEFFNEDLDDTIYQKAREIHYALQRFIREYELTDNSKEYYDFFFENIVKNNLTSQQILDKYINGGNNEL